MCIYSKSRRSEIDQSLFAGFMTALNSFSKEISSEMIRSFKLGKTKYVISNTNQMLFIAKTELKAKEEDVHKILKEMETIFFDNFPPETFKEDWDGNLNMFSVLDPFYDRFLSDSEEKMRSAIW
ncbi:MAG TPA: hypothetical protein VKK79_03675 [Candidatus Lokiarchaeia archaeon]|nr:hypothetical protein [Candidatus Lokiarchaeia archaeon]